MPDFGNLPPRKAVPADVQARMDKSVLARFSLEPLRRALGRDVRVEERGSEFVLIAEPVQRQAEELVDLGIHPKVQEALGEQVGTDLVDRLRQEAAAKVVAALLTCLRL